MDSVITSSCRYCWVKTSNVKYVRLLCFVDTRLVALAETFSPSSLAPSRIWHEFGADYTNKDCLLWFFERSVLSEEKLQLESGYLHIPAYGRKYRVFLATFWYIDEGDMGLSCIPPKVSLMRWRSGSRSGSRSRSGSNTGSVNFWEVMDSGPIEFSTIRPITTRYVLKLNIAQADC